MSPLPPILLALASAMLVACAPPTKAEEELNIHEALFRGAFQGIASGHRKFVGPYYIGIADESGKGIELPDEFMKRFAGNKPPVKRSSELKSSEEKGEKLPGPPLIFGSGPIAWVSDTEVIVDFTFFPGGMDNILSRFRLKKSDGKWQAIKPGPH